MPIMTIIASQHSPANQILSCYVVMRMNYFVCVNVIMYNFNVLYENIEDHMVVHFNIA